MIQAKHDDKGEQNWDIRSMKRLWYR